MISAYQFVFFNICVLYSTTQTLDEGTIGRYFEYLSDICLYSDICNATRKAELEVSDNDIPCCHSCSCDIGCVEDRNCCLDEMYEKHNTVKEKCMNVGYSKVADSYLIVDTCPNAVSELDGDGLEKYVANNSCADVIFQPVSSMKMDKIYVNSVCARCNGATDVKVWDVMVEIRPDEMFSINVEQILNSFPHEFLSPKNENWSHKKCILATESCSPNYSNATVQSLCYSIEAPIKVGFKIFKNAFCALCYGISEYIIRLNRVCVSSGIDRIPSSTFTILLNYRTLKGISSSEAHVTLSANLVCSKNKIEAHNKTDCLPLRCPIGMTRNDRGDCFYIGAEWAGNYALNILLRKTSDKPLTRAFLDILKKTSGIKLLDRIDLPAPCKTFEFSGVILYDELVNNTKDIEQLLVVLYRQVNGKGEHPEKIIESCRSCLIDYWRLAIKTESFTFKPSLFQHKSIPDGNTKLIKLGDTSNGPPWITTPTRFQFLHATKKALNLLMNEPFVNIHKLVFCNQLFLPLNEVLLGYGELVIESTGKVLYNNEFELIDDRRVAVCAEDYVVETTVVSWALQTKGVSVLHAVYVNLLIMGIVM